MRGGSEKKNRNLKQISASFRAELKTKYEFEEQF
jgi:hypothetical protein